MKVRDRGAGVGQRADEAGQDESAEEGGVEWTEAPQRVGGEATQGDIPVAAAHLDQMRDDGAAILRETGQRQRRGEDEKEK